MNVVCKKNALLKVLSIALNSVSDRTTVEALKCFKLKAKKDELFVTSNNLETNVIASLKAKVNQDGETLVHAKTFYNIISKLPAGDITLYLNESNTIIINAKNSTFNIVISNIEDFPEDMTIEEFKEIYLDKNMFKDMIKRVSFASSSEEEKIILNGVLFEVAKEDNKLVFVAADGYRLAKDEIKFKSEQGLRTIIPIKAIKEVVSIINNTDPEEFFIQLSKETILFCMDGIKIYSRVINGQFPDPKLLIPTESNLEIKINRKDFLSGCERINIIAEKNSNMVKTEVLDKNLVISSVTPDFGDGSEKITVDINGDDSISLILNVKLMIDVLKNIEADFISIKIIDDEKPIVIREENNDAYVYVMMPIKIKRN